MEDCLSRLSPLRSTGPGEAEASGVSVNFSRLRLTEDALLNKRTEGLSLSGLNVSFTGNSWDGDNLQLTAVQ